MHVERKWHILLTIFFLLISSGQCMDSKQVKQNERRTLLDLILQVIKDSQQRDKPVSRRCGSGLHTSAQDFKSSSREKPLYVPRLDNTRLIGKLIRFIFRTWWWKHNPHFTVGDSCHWSAQCSSFNVGSFSGLAKLKLETICIFKLIQGIWTFYWLQIFIGKGTMPIPIWHKYANCMCSSDCNDYIMHLTQVSKLHMCKTKSLHHTYSD